MSLVYIYNNSWFFFTFLTFIYVVIRFKLVLEHLCGNFTCQARHANDMLTLTCWRAKYGETVQKIFTIWFGTYCIYVCFLSRFDASYRKLFVSFITMFYFCLAAVVIQVGKYWKYSVFIIIFRYSEKYCWKSIISILKYCTLHKTNFVLQYWQTHFFSTTPTTNIGIFFRFVGS